MRKAGLALLALTALAAEAPPATGSIDIEISGLRSAKGLVQVCLTAAPKHFPDCGGDPLGRHLTVPAAAPLGLRFTGLTPGSYAISLFHDENGNGKLDTRLGIPTEGFGFSNNPRMLFGPPRFAAARIAVGTGAASETVRLKYLF